MTLMTERRIQFYILICYFIKSNAVYSAEENQFPKGHQERLGSHQPPEGNIEELLEMPTPSVFYDNYVAKSKPVILKGAAKESDAFKLWTDNYLSESFGDVEVNVDYGKKENRERPADVMTLRGFLEIYNKTNRYLVDSLPDALQSEFQLPQCILCGGFTNRLTDSVIWFSSGGTKSFLHIDNVENINCLISGQKEWFFIDKSFALLDQNEDNILVAEEIETRDPEILEIALQRTPPGEINIRGMAQSKDPKLLGILKRIKKQEPYIEEFLLRIHKSTDDIRNFLETFSEKLHIEIKEYLQEILNEHSRPTDRLREEL